MIASTSLFQASIRAEAEYFDVNKQLQDILAKLGNSTDGGDGGDSISAQAQNELDLKLIEMAEETTRMLTDATEGMNYNSLTEVQQGVAVLYSITSVSASDPVAAKTLDSAGREAATGLIKVQET